MNKCCGLGLALGMAVLNSCGADKPLSWVQPQVATYFNLAAPTTGSTRPISVWHSQAGDLFLTSEAAHKKRSALLKEVLAYNKSKFLVMVTLVPGHRLTSELAADPLTLAYQAPTVDHAGFALVAVPDTAALDGLASAVHGRATAGNAADGGLACGRIELLTLTDWAEAKTYTPAVYAESVKLSEVASLLSQPKRANLIVNIKTLEDMGTREHSTATGLQATAKVKDLFVAAFAGSDLDVTYEEVSHEDYYPTAQKSLIVKIAGTDPNAPMVIMGAHLDSINGSGVNLPAPGADDNASGIATLVEIARIVAHGGQDGASLKFTRPIELHAYATEEKGLIGSGDIATRYAADGKKVAAMLQVDMDAYSKDTSDSTIYLVENDTSATLRRSLKDLLSTYLDGGFTEMSLKAGSSDHRSWTRHGFYAVFPFEHPINHNLALHTEDDTSANLNNMGLAERFSKLGLTFLAHYAGLESSKDGYAAAYSAHKVELSSDLKIAISESDTADFYGISIGTAIDIAAVELCTITTAGAMDCNAARSPLALDRSTGKRLLFNIATAITLGDGDRLAVFGYDASDKLVAVRTIKLDKK